MDRRTQLGRRECYVHLRPARRLRPTQSLKHGTLRRSFEAMTYAERNRMTRVDGLIGKDQHCDWPPAGLNSRGSGMPAAIEVSDERTNEVKGQASEFRERHSSLRERIWRAGQKIVSRNGSTNQWNVTAAT